MIVDGDPAPRSQGQCEIGARFGVAVADDLLGGDAFLQCQSQFVLGCNIGTQGKLAGRAYGSPAGVGFHGKSDQSVGIGGLQDVLKSHRVGLELLREDDVERKFISLDQPIDGFGVLPQQGFESIRCLCHMGFQFSAC